MRAFSSIAGFSQTLESILTGGQQLSWRHPLWPLGDEVASATVLPSLLSSMFTICFRIVQTSQVCGGTTSGVLPLVEPLLPITSLCGGRRSGAGAYRQQKKTLLTEAMLYWEIR